MANFNLPTQQASTGWVNKVLVYLTVVKVRHIHLCQVYVWSQW